MKRTVSWGESIVFKMAAPINRPLSFPRNKMALLKLSTSHAVALISADTVVAKKMGDALDQIDDMGEIFEIMKSLQIPTKGLKNCEEMKAKIRDFLKESATKKVSEVSALFFLFFYRTCIIIYGKQILRFSASSGANFIPSILLLTEVENYFFLVEVVSQVQLSSCLGLSSSERFTICWKITFSDTRTIPM